jgi:hypothetical protein
MDPNLDPKRRQSIDKIVAIPINHENPNHINLFNQYSLTSHDLLYLVFYFDKAILEVMTSPKKPWDDLHHKSFFLPKLGRVEAGDFTMTMNGDVTCHVNPLAMHKVYAKGKMVSIAEMIPIDISKTHGIIENIFIGVDSPPQGDSGVH